MPRSAALMAIGGDSLWVIASIVVLLSATLPLTTTGKWGGWRWSPTSSASSPSSS